MSSLSNKKRKSGLSSASTLCIRILSDLSLHKSWSCHYRLCEFLCLTALLYQEYFSYTLPVLLFTDLLLKLCVRRGCDRDVSFRNDFSPTLSAGWLIVDLCVNHQLLKKKASMIRLRDASIYVYKFAKKIIFLKNDLT